jgi:hypothetical protein
VRYLEGERSVSTSTPARVAVTAIMDALILVAVLLVAAIVVAFFGTLAGTGVGQGIMRIASYLTLPIGLDPIATPYGGEFLTNATATVLIALIAEWLLSGARQRF